MKLQLSAEDVEMVLQEHSLQAMQRIPTAVHEVKRMQVPMHPICSNIPKHALIASTMATCATSHLLDPTSFSE